MNELTIRPTLKFIKAGLFIAAGAGLALELAYWLELRHRVGAWAMVLPPLILLWPAMRALRRQISRTVIGVDRLRYESGVASKSIRTLPLSKLQDVRVQQGLFQRMFNVGDLSLETVGTEGHLTIANVDSPQALAEEILNRAHSQR